MSIDSVSFELVDSKKIQTAIRNKKKKHEIEMQWNHLDDFPNQCYGIFKIRNKYVAFAELSDDELEKNGLFIANFEVCKSSRGNGVGEKAFETIVGLCKGAGGECISLMAKDQNSKNFWLKMGCTCEYDDINGIAMKYFIQSD